MDASDFYEEIQRIIPSREKFNHLSNEFMNSYLNDLRIVKKEESTFKNYFNDDDVIFDLIYNFDVSNLRIQVFSFADIKNLIENEMYIYFGWREAFPLGILKRTNEIVELDWENPNKIISFAAKNQSKFLDALIELEKLNQKRMFSEIDSQARKSILNNFGKYAGGDKYNTFYTDL